MWDKLCSGLTHETRLEHLQSTPMLVRAKASFGIKAPGSGQHSSQLQGSLKLKSEVKLAVFITY